MNFSYVYSILNFSKINELTYSNFYRIPMVL